NLTVNGDYKINFIGDGINKTIIDGEAKYTIDPDPGYVWGSSKEWYPYINCSGNYAMNITKGTGYITLSNMNIQHMINIGGADISLNPQGGVTNYANLSVNNVLFYQNLGGVGASIQNKHNATLTVNNSIFQENRKSNTTGNFGAGIYNNGTASVTNSLFKDNLARWGTLTNDGIIDIINCTFRDGKSYDGGSTFKFGTAIVANSGGANYAITYEVLGLVTNVINCTFYNNEQTDIYGGSGNLYVKDCNFNHSTGIYMTGNAGTLKTGIYNSTFNDMQPSNLFGSLSVTTDTIFAIYSTTTRNTTIQGNNINFTGNGYGMYLTGNNTVTNNTLNKYILISGNSNNIIHNNIITNDIYSINLKNSKNNNISDNTIYSQIFTGDKAVLSSNTENIIKNNIPITGSYIDLTNDNYKNYFDNNGVIKTDVVENGSIITIAENITNKDLTFSNIKALLSSKKNVYIQNGSISIINNASMIINNTNIINNNKVGLLIDSDNNLITYNNIMIDSNKPIEAIIIKKDNNNLKNNNINITSTTNSTGILIKSSDNTLEYNDINIITNTSSMDTITKGIFLLGNNSKVEKNYLDYMKIVINTNANTIGVQLQNSNNNQIKSNVFIDTASNAIRTLLEDSGYNKITLGSSRITSNNTAYGVIVKGNPILNRNNSILTSYDNLELTSTNSIGILLENTNNTNIKSISSGSNYIIKGDYARAILTNNTNNTDIYYINIYLSTLTKTNPDLIAIEQINSENTNITAMSMKNIPNDYNYKGNFLKLSNTNNTYVGSAQDISNTTININDIAIIMENSNNNIIENISITTQTDYVINLTNSNNNKITNNYLNGNNFRGGDSTVIQTNSKNNRISNNTPEIIILTNNNYNDYFINQIFTPNAPEIVLGSNLYNKNMTFNHPISLKNPRNYIIYNGTITLTENTTKSIINGLIINNTDDRKTSLNINAKQVTINNLNIYQENKENQAQAIHISENASATISSINLTLNAPEINSEDNIKISTATYTEGSLTINKGLITINTTKTVENGKIIALINTNISNTNITVNAKNNATAILVNNKKVSISSNNITMNATQNTPIYMENSESSTINKNTIITNTTIQNIFKNTTRLSITANNMIAENQTKIPLIIIENSDKATITENYLKTKDLKGQLTIEVINSTDITMNQNKPGVLITNENYNQYFTNQTLNSDIDTIELGSNIYNKNMTFNHQVQIENPNNYTIYNGTLTFTENARSSTITGINIHNTDDRESTLIIYASGVRINENNIYQENINNPMKTIIITKSKTLTINQNNITTIGKIITIISLNNNNVMAGRTITNNNIYGIGENITAIELLNCRSITRITDNIIMLKSKNPTTAIKIEKLGGTTVSKNTIIIKTKNYNTPIIELINTTINNFIRDNYIESEDVCGNDAVKKIGTGTATISNNKPTNGNYRTQMNITLPSELKVSKTYPITINVTSMLDKPVNGTVILNIEDKETNLTLTDGIATYNYTPTKDGETTIKIT
ncbi:hypothetical protein, partial [uncultured Methanosphaera sp.]|uniref:beta strand repeat-containing protein n=1 Tax=uncultured Methanosphaera sp. TaxID=262501 RepID=UPI0025928F9A